MGGLSEKQGPKVVIMIGDFDLQVASWPDASGGSGR
jgi:hypothetical protein